MKEEALKFIEDNLKYRYVKTNGIDLDKEWYVEPWVAREAVEIALKRKRKPAKRQLAADLEPTTEECDNWE